MGWRPAQAWTSKTPVAGYRHFRLVLQGGKGRERWVELEAVLDASIRHRLTWRELRNSPCWSSGWQQIPPADPEADPPEGSALNSEAESNPQR
ncbi:MAG: TIGR02450 family Trp-rich protein [Synechococcus sp.]